MRLQRVQTGDPFVSVDELKAYLQFTGTGKDNELTEAIESATAAFEDKRNISLRDMIVELVAKSDDKGVIRLYYPNVSEIISVELIDRSRADYALLLAVDSITVRPESTHVVTYKTEAHKNASAFKSAVMAMAALIFDGNTDAQAYQTVLGRWA